MAQNVEVKIRISDPLALKSLIASTGARDEGEMHQIDTFFGGVKRLKLREFGKSMPGQLIAYDRPDSEGLRTCNYRMCTVSNPVELKETLAYALPLLRTVEKIRHLYLLNRTRIHVDDVKGLGSFIELEVLLGPKDEIASGEAEALDILRKLNLADEPRIGGSYFDLMKDDPKIVLANDCG
jgi:adenylate cyclase class IV